ncbi:hypothetical protein ACFLSA_05380 [Bacteroidota bacterium]
MWQYKSHVRLMVKTRLKGVSLVGFFLFCMIQVNEAQEWKRYRYDYSWGAGINLYSGDINSVAITDNFSNIGGMANLGGRYRITNRMAVKVKISGGIFRAQEKYIPESSYYGRQFRTYFLDPCAQLELYLKPSSLKVNKSGFDFRTIGIYIFSGGSYPLYLPTGNLPSNFSVSWEPGSGQNIFSSVQKSFFLPLGGGLTFNLRGLQLISLELETRIPFPYTIDYKSITKLSEFPSGYFIDGYENFVSATSPVTDLLAFFRFEMVYPLRTGSNGLPMIKRPYKSAYKSIACPYRKPVKYRKLKRRKSKYRKLVSRGYKGVRRKR